MKTLLSAAQNINKLWWGGRTVVRKRSLYTCDQTVDGLEVSPQKTIIIPPCHSCVMKHSLGRQLISEADFNERIERNIPGEEKLH